jgi:TetR/AcrR family transcriptional repressor of bet genes
MISTQAAMPAKKRTEPKEKRQLQLIKATIRSIAINGLSDTTVATVSKEAGMSQGIINLHFQSKDKLLLETLAYVVDEYKTRWESALEKAGDNSADRLEALIDVDFNKSVCDRNKLSVWFAFWSETRSRPTYRKLCAERDRAYDETMVDLCADIIRQGKYSGIDAAMAARGLASLTQGLWLDILINPRIMSRIKAREVSMAYLYHLFPRHFPPLSNGVA